MSTSTRRTEDFDNPVLVLMPRLSSLRHKSRYVYAYVVVRTRLNVKSQAIYRRICMGSSEHNCGNKSLTICTNILIFSKDTYLVLISRMISTNHISSQILILVTSHFATLLNYYLTDTTERHLLM